MSDAKTNPPGPIHSDSQAERWLKYGGNVALSCVAVIGIAALLIYLAEWKPRHWDTTESGQYSLKPQTIKLIEDNKQKIKIVNLYTRSKPPQQDETASTDKTTQADLDTQATAVDDLLDEYRSRGKNITIDSIDPIKEPAKVDALINDVTNQFSGQVTAYKKFTEDLKPIYESIGKQADGEVAKIQALPVPNKGNLKSDAAANFRLAFESVSEISEILKDRESAYRRALRERIPNYKAVTDDVEQNMPELSALLGLIIDGFEKIKTDNTVPAEYRKYATDNLPAYSKMKQQIDDLVAGEKKLGELKLDTLKTALAQRNPILVRGETSWKVIPYDQVWHDVRDARNSTEETPAHARFSGEQAITTAILALTEPVKPKVCFVRSGGPPDSSEGGLFASVGDKLRLYNYDVTDKDLTGQYAMMAAQQQQMAPPEPTDAEIADAIWVVDGTPHQNREQMQMGMPPPQPIGPAVAEHLAHGFHYVNGVKTPGGMAFFIVSFNGEPFTESLGPLGITVRPGAAVVHQKMTIERGPNMDFFNLVRAEPPVFIVEDWGTHPITTPIGALPGVLAVPALLRGESAAGVALTPLIPIQSDLQTWADTNAIALTTSNSDPKYDPETAKDKSLAPPYYGAYAAENSRSGTRVVVCGSPESFAGRGDFGQGPVDMDDPILADRGVHRTAFPGDAEFFMNSIYWLGHRESMIAMSPAAMTVDRIGPISPGLLAFWHVGVLLLAIPGLAVAIGAAVFFARRG